MERIFGHDFSTSFCNKVSSGELLHFAFHTDNIFNSGLSDIDSKW